MKVDIRLLIRQLMAIYNVKVTEIQAPYHQIASNDYFHLRELLNASDHWQKEAVKAIKTFPLDKVTVIEDFLGVCHMMFFLPDTRNCLLIGPYRTNQMDKEKLTKIGADAEQMVHLKEIFMTVPLVEEKLMNMNLGSMISIMFEKETFELNRIVEENPKVFIPDKALFQKKEIGIDERMELIKNRYSAENEVLDAVASGNAAKALEAMGKMGGRDIVQRFSLSLRSQKNSLIIFSTLMRKAIERAGVHPYYIDEISSRYSNMIEMVMDNQEYLMMMNMMVREYCDYAVRYGNRQYSPMIQKAVAIVNEEISEPLTLNKVAVKLNLNPSYLSNLFKKETGMTMGYYIHQTKIRASCDLLKTTQSSVAQIAEAVGFIDVNYFCRIFRRQMGCSPTEYKKR